MRITCFYIISFSYFDWQLKNPIFVYSISHCYFPPPPHPNTLNNSRISLSTTSATSTRSSWKFRSP